MATESLIVELDAKTQKLDAKLRATERRLDELDGTTKKTDKSLGKISSTAKVLGTSLVAAGVAIAALTAGTIALIKQTTSFGKELKIASTLAGVATEEFQAMAFATSTVGIDLEKLGDISKDTREKIGDFLNTGGGGFQDFVDAMKLTKKEAKLVADEFATLSGPQILQEMVTRMEDAEVSAVQMSHALEGMASDTTNLIPLLANGGAEMKRLSDAMSDITVPLTDEDLQKLADLDGALNLAAASASNLANNILIDLSDWFVNAANAASFFFASLNEGSISSKQVRLLETIEEIKTLEEGMSNADTAMGRLWNTLTFNTSQDNFAIEKINALLLEQKEIQEDIAKIRSPSGSSVLPDLQVTDKPDGSGLNADDNQKALQAITDRFKDEETLLFEKLGRELAIIADDQVLREELLDEHLINVVALHQKEEDDLKSIREKAAKETKKLTKEQIRDEQVAARNKLDNQQNAVRLGMAINTALFDDNKAIAAGLIIADTAVGIQKSLSINPYDYVNVGIIAATGALNLANAANASKGGGGSISSPSGGSSPQQPVEQELSTLNLSTQDEDSANVLTVRFATDSGDQLLDALAEGLNENQRRGR